MDNRESLVSGKLKSQVSRSVQSALLRTLYQVGLICLSAYLLLREHAVTSAHFVRLFINALYSPVYGSINHLVSYQIRQSGSIFQKEML